MNNFISFEDKLNLSASGNNLNSLAIHMFEDSRAVFIWITETQIGLGTAGRTSNLRKRWRDERLYTAQCSATHTSKCCQLLVTEGESLTVTYLVLIRQLCLYICVSVYISLVTVQPHQCLAANTPNEISSLKLSAFISRTRDNNIRQIQIVPFILLCIIDLGQNFYKHMCFGVLLIAGLVFPRYNSISSNNVWHKWKDLRRY